MKKYLWLYALTSAMPLLAQPEILEEVACQKPVATWTQEKGGVGVHVTQYHLVKEVASNKKHTKKERQLFRPFYPIEICITNNTDTLIALDPAACTLESVDLKEFARLSKSSAVFASICIAEIPAVAAMGFGGYCFMSAAAIPVTAGWKAGLAGWLLTMGGYFSLALGGFLALAALPIAFFIGNAIRHAPYKKLMLHKTIRIKPGQTIRRFIFVLEEDYTPQFSLATQLTTKKLLSKLEAEPTVFNVQLHAS